MQGDLWRVLGGLYVGIFGKTMKCLSGLEI